MFVLRKNKEQYFNFQGKTHRIVRGNSHWCDNQSHFQICMVALHYTCKWKLTLKTKLTIAYTMSVTKSNSHDGKRSIQSINCHITVTTGQIYSGSTFHVRSWSRMTISFAFPGGISFMSWGSCWWLVTAVIILQWNSSEHKIIKNGIFLFNITCIWNKQIMYFRCQILNSFHIMILLHPVSPYFTLCKSL